MTKGTAQYEMPDRAEEYSVPLEKGDVSVSDRGIPKEFPFFFSLLKRKKEAKKKQKKKSLPPTLVLCGNVSHDWQCDSYDFAIH